MARLGTFDPTLLPQGWFDESAVLEGWYDSELIQAGSVAHAIVGAVLVTATPAASLLDITRHAGIVGSITTTVTPAASLLDVTQHVAIVGAVTVSVSPAALMRYTAAGGAGQHIEVAVSAARRRRGPIWRFPLLPHEGVTHAIEGDVTVRITPRATLTHAAAWTDEQDDEDLEEILLLIGAMHA